MKMCIDFTDFTAKRDVYHNIVTVTVWFRLRNKETGVSGRTGF